jgi:hypothetical protein
MTTTNAPAQKPKKGNGSAKKETLMAGGAETSPGEDRVAIAAYYRAEQRNFAPGDELADWFQAEAEVKKGANQHAN